MNNSKNIYGLLNEINFNIEDYEKEKLTDVEKQNFKESFKKNVKGKFNLRKFGSIAAVLILTVGILSQTNLGKNVYAATESKISEISYSIGRALGIERNIESYANVINQVVESNGVEVKLTDVIIDKDKLILSTIINTNKPIDGFRFNYDIYINGKKLNDYGGIGSSGAIDDSKTLFYEMYSFEVKGIDIKEDVDIRIVLDDFNYHMEGLEKGEIKEEKIKGKWEFEFTANGSELTTNTHALPLDYSFNIDNTKYILEEFRYNPVNQNIYGKIEDKNKGFEYDIRLKGEDNLGNKVVFYLSSSDGENLIFRYSNLYGDLADEITSINLTPYAVKFPEESGRLNNDWKEVGEEFTIYINK